MPPKSSPELTGSLHQIPFQSARIGSQTAPLFSHLATEYGLENVLVVKRFPTGIDAIEHAYAGTVEGVEQPTVTGLSAHARRVLSEVPDPPALLDQGARNLLLSTFVRDRKWDNPYLAGAAAQESFTSDVGRFVTEATWQGGAIETDDQALEELADTNTAFHEWLAGADQLDPSRSLQVAIEALDDADQRAAIQEEFDVVLALEFEEFTAIDRAYLAYLTLGVPLFCVAEADSAIQRTWNEPRPITDYVPELEPAGTVGPAPDEEPAAPAAVAAYLATGDSPVDPADASGAVRVIETDTFSDEIAAIAEEIERLHRTAGIPYDDMAVVLRDSNAPIPETLRGLRAAGVPVSSATVGGLEHDPAARELYALVSWCFRVDDPAPRPGQPAENLPGWDLDRALATLEARVEPHVDDPEAVLETVQDRAATHGLADGVNYWLLATALKHRIGTGETTLDAKTQFGHVRTLRQLVRDIEASALLDGDWRTLCEGFEEELQRATTDKIATELALPEGGVLVDAVRVLKNEQRTAVFMVDVIDREYPADPSFTSLFPTPHLEQLDGYPAFTTPTAEDVTETFTPASNPNRPLHAYYAALSRRMLAVGARCASDRLYFGLHRQNATGTGSRQQPSRFLAELEDTFGSFDRGEHEGIYSHGAAVQFALIRVDSSLERVRRAGLVSEPIDIADIEAEFEGVQRILDDEPPADLAPAIEARLDFAEGGVRRD